MKFVGLLDLPGTGTGPLRRRSPQARLCIGGLLLLAILLTPLAAPWGVLAILGIGALGVAIAGTPIYLIGRTVLVFTVLYVPLLLFLLLSSLFTANGLQLSWIGPSAQVGDMALRSFAILIVATAILSSLTIPDLIRGSSVLPVPRIAVAILFHVLHQAGLMLRETVSISRAIALRGGTRGFRTGVVIARSLPSVWLPRVEARIERAARAADVRGADHNIVSLQPSRWRDGDPLFILLACCFPIAAAAIRFLP